jgi:hypothetical protein
MVWIYGVIGLDYMFKLMFNAKRAQTINSMFFSCLETWDVNDKLCIHTKVKFENLKVERYQGCISDSNGWGMVDCMHIDVVLITKLKMRFKR